jgi:hypothetical protein
MRDGENLSKKTSKAEALVGKDLDEFLRSDESLLWTLTIFCTNFV